MPDVPSEALPVREAIARHLAATRHATDHGWRGDTGDETAWEQRDQDVLDVWRSEADILLRYVTRPDVLAEVVAMAGGDGRSGASGVDTPDGVEWATRFPDGFLLTYPTEALARQAVTDANPGLLTLVTRTVTATPWKETPDA
jgi:hypothetical protein